MLGNNDILKKLKVALSLCNDNVIKILSLSNFEISKGALGDLFRNEDHPDYVQAGDQVLRNFLNGLIIYNRGQVSRCKVPVSKIKKIINDRSSRFAGLCTSPDLLHAIKKTSPALFAGSS
jgi:Protein of unknown function (DUF1456)